MEVRNLEYEFDLPHIGFDKLTSKYWFELQLKKKFKIIIWMSLKYIKIKTNEHVLDPKVPWQVRPRAISHSDGRSVQLAPFNFLFS